MPQRTKDLVRAHAHTHTHKPSPGDAALLEARSVWGRGLQEPSCTDNHSGLSGGTSCGARTAGSGWGSKATEKRNNPPAWRPTRRQHKRSARPPRQLTMTSFRRRVKAPS